MNYLDCLVCLCQGGAGTALPLNAGAVSVKIRLSREQETESWLAGSAQSLPNTLGMLGWIATLVSSVYRSFQEKVDSGRGAFESHSTI